MTLAGETLPELSSDHGTGPSHLCLLDRKHQVEDAIYDAQPATMTT